MKPLVLAVMLLSALSGCTAVHESLMPHRDVMSPCVCLDDAAPINDPALLRAIARRTV